MSFEPLNTEEDLRKGTGSFTGGPKTHLLGLS
jgi:hypothetical protein